MLCHHPPIWRLLVEQHSVDIWKLVLCTCVLSGLNWQDAHVRRWDYRFADLKVSNPHDNRIVYKTNKLSDFSKVWNPDIILANKVSGGYTDGVLIVRNQWRVICKTNLVILWMDQRTTIRLVIARFRTGFREGIHCAITALRMRN